MEIRSKYRYWEVAEKLAQRRLSPYDDLSFRELEAARAVGEALGPLRDVSAPPPSDKDFQVSQVDGLDFDPAQFTGGVESIERKGDSLIVHFTNGGQICASNGVTYVAPEKH